MGSTRRGWKAALFCLFFTFAAIQGYAEEPFEKNAAQVLDNRERLIRLETKMEEGFKGVDQRFVAMDQRFTSMDQRLTDMDRKFDQRFSDMGQRITDMNNLIYVVLGGIIALIGFVIWDRRTAVAPVARKNRELEERGDLLEKALREYAKKEPRLAEVLRNIGLF
jgi:hypothetical protein